MIVWLYEDEVVVVWMMYNKNNFVLFCLITIIKLYKNDNDRWCDIYDDKWLTMKDER